MQEKNEGGRTQTGLSWSTPAASTPAQKPVVPQKAAPAAAAQSAAGGTTSKYVSMVVVGVLAGVLIAWGYSSWRAPAGGATTSTATSTADTKSATTADTTGLGIDTTTLPVIGSDATLTIASPQKPGTSVAVEKAVVSTPTWVVVYENKDGKPGNALGAALFFPESQSGTVELLRGTVSGRSYLAARQVDNGDRKFSLKDDQFLTEGGKVVWVTFEVK